MSPVRKKSEQEGEVKAPRTRKTSVPSASKVAESAKTPRKRSTKSQKAVSPEERRKMIELEAYFMAEKDGFRGSPESYWLAAEAIVEARLKGK